MIKKAQPNEFNPYFSRYIDLVEDGAFEVIFSNNKTSIIDFFQSIPSEIHEYRYAEGKWTPKEILMHIIDTERVMLFRGFVAARGDKNILPTFDENKYAETVSVKYREMDSLIREFEMVRNASEVFFMNLSDIESKTVGNVNQSPFTASAAAYICMGHPLHHINIIKERYLKKP